ncbi:right-handed parallel beta-helix repeat-containing protein [Peribacillus sp. B-H-3]|uniref:right-handed parallel beta-helix repeat-containing protein n=1 Tax=Peribacillus sp. B-H-3 TaxID=3400420 RepID=UPI003B0186FF
MQKKYFAPLLAFVLLIGLLAPFPAHAGTAVYTITPDSKPYDKKMLLFKSYNKYTKHYYLLRSYLELLEKKGGGTLVLKKGTYTITNTLYVPSNVTIMMKDGTRVVKGVNTGTKIFGPSKSLFQLIRPTRAAKSGVYGGYNGEKNISFIGEGDVKMDLMYVPDSLAVIMGHNKNVNVKNIGFYHMNSGHFIEMDASQNVRVENCKFIDSLPSLKQNKEAINLDTPDHATLGWSQKWSKFDKTANDTVFIENNLFQNLDRAVGTHKYSEGMLHKHVTLSNNIIEGTRLDSIRVMNWSDAVIEYNTISDVADGVSKYRGMLVSGASNPVIQYNTFVRAGRPIQFIVHQNTGPGEEYAEIYNELSDGNYTALETNIVIDTKENFIRYNAFLNDYSNENTVRIPCIVEEE